MAKKNPPIKKKYIESPERMWELFEEYRKEVESNPIMVVEQKKGNTSIKVTATTEGVNFTPPSDLVYLPHQRPLTFEGFENYLADQQIIQDVGDYFSNKDNRYESYAAVCSRIKRTIRQDHIEGGMAGIYNPSITQRLNGLAENVNNNNRTEQPLFPD